MLPYSLDVRRPDHSIPHLCSVPKTGVIVACVSAFRCDDTSPHARYRWSDTENVVRCVHCGAIVSAALPARTWAEMLAPSAPALPSPNARGNELRSIVADGLDGVRVTLAEKRPLKAREYADALAWDALAAIAAGCDDPAGLARDLAVLRAEVSAAQR